ncbi:hypothetical protein OS242_10505 [Tumebacillus sp. DT12]|uniref:Uncharacterized protein n=1 Tax=Tumebacillus lacus TaxID=2995335 RepID=A0ABT3X0F6_9BACL|nr:hypothetical protein [Tumebacillus lacus]MCX7570393.1 hypothetical protein [Tumebacillus lacus]
MQEIKVKLDITGTDKFKALAELTATAITTHPNRNELERAFYELAGESPEGYVAGGKITTAGLQLVGDKGPEIMNMPRGSTVQPA